MANDLEKVDCFASYRATFVLPPFLRLWRKRRSCSSSSLSSSISSSVECNTMEAGEGRGMITNSDSDWDLQESLSDSETTLSEISSEENTTDYEAASLESNDPLVDMTTKQTNLYAEQCQHKSRCNQWHPNMYGTVKITRKEMPPELKKEKLKKGEIKAYRRGKVTLMQWRDKKE
ncbi:hypothetical protein J437_LFUL004368 [Ladona fulva]|uniref:Uncharacterized protein n=1 Tax=Ladona fulva TaxID=123851 RepID=A0A8K0K4K7_LADFU|nr:hypothetical protein J437_LFUL004368 [Ladona fulva]